MTLVIACATVMEEIHPYLSPGMSCRVLDFGLHLDPGRLRNALQEAIDQSGADTILLGYGLCSNAAVGLRATRCTLVIPRVDDCIAIFLGSREAHRRQHQTEPGTYYLTKGWIEAGDSPFAEYARIADKYGQPKAERIIKLMLANYKRLALINTGQYQLERYRDYARREAERFGLRYEEIEGSADLVKKMISGPWDDDFVVVNPGETVGLDRFFPSSDSAPVAER